MAEVRDELLTREITRAELKELVDAWVAAGGKIKQCKPADAYSFSVSPFNMAQRDENGTVRVRKSLRSWIDKGAPKRAKKAKKAKGKKK